MKKGFTLIELLVVISIIGILVGLSLFGIEKTRGSSRDARRMADLEQIRSGLEMYKADCGDYPTSARVVGGSALVGDGTPAVCATTNIYIPSVPEDPIDPTSKYSYKRLTSTTYILCAALEQAPNPAMGVTDCASCTVACNYKVTNP